ncbi:hypothetical protein BaRGS_00006246 [Batillaria attramentaria]|uniref:Uncharacterized protein n=1 Tax=Batillaria attramentaria TaxID=370345 RepID=A0ABD0LT47_9CAEN
MRAAPTRTNFLCSQSWSRNDSGTDRTRSVVQTVMPQQQQQHYEPSAQGRMNGRELHITTRIVVVVRIRQCASYTSPCLSGLFLLVVVVVFCF